jgi:hypothetical protein
MIRVMLLSTGLIACSAMELTMADVPVTVGTGPNTFSYEIDNGTTVATGTDAADLAVTLRAGVRKGLPQRARSHGVVLGAELGFDQYDLGIGTDRRFGANGLLGWGWSPVDNVSFVLSGLAGLGYGTITLDGSATAPGWSGSGRSFTIGVRLATLVNLSRFWLIEVDLGWESIDHRASADGTAVHIAPSGMTTGLGGVYRFEPIPVRLE